MRPLALSAHQNQPFVTNGGGSAAGALKFIAQGLSSQLAVVMV